MADEEPERLRIDVWADLVCPWCFIGKQRLHRVLAERELTDRVQIVHRAFQLDPGVTSAGEPVVDHLAAKYGVTRDEASAMMDAVTEAAATEGLDYRLDRTVRGNTRDAHRLVLWAQERDPDVAQALLGDLYSAYFEQGSPIFTTEELVPFAVDRGLDAEAVRAMLTGHAWSAAVAEDQSIGRAQGVNGVPFFAFDGRIGFSGAQPPAMFSAALDQAFAGHP